QYDVYASNQTGQDIRIEYRTDNSKNGAEENSITVKNGETNQLLISTREISKYENQPLKDRFYCSKVASHITAFTVSGLSIEKDWCDEQIRIETVDVGQAEYLISYTKEDL
ncbi:MAG: hypothetical protein ACI9FN_002332, partial [Saprospiraceae bacterium]